MEKNQYDIISDIKTLIDSLKEQVAVLESRLEELEAITEEMVEENALEEVAEEIAEELPAEAEEVIDDLPEEEVAVEEPAVVAEEEPVLEEAPVPAPAPVAEPEPEALPELEPLPEPEPEPIAEPEPEVLPEPVEEPADMPVIEDMPMDIPSDEPIDISIDMEDFPGIGDIPEAQAPVQEPVHVKSLEEEFSAAPAAKSINDVEQTKAKKTVIDAAREKQAWRKDMPGTPVKNIISAISLADRALLINTLFKGDPIAFNDAITAFNGMASFEEAEQYINENHSGWNMNSDIVYRLMMAIRRKLK